MLNDIFYRMEYITYLPLLELLITLFMEIESEKSLSMYCAVTHYTVLHKYRKILARQIW